MRAIHVHGSRDARRPAHLKNNVPKIHPDLIITKMNILDIFSCEYKVHSASIEEESLGSIFFAMTVFISPEMVPSKMKHN